MSPELIDIPHGVNRYLKDLRTIYEDICKYTDELSQLKNYNNFS